MTSKELVAKTIRGENDTGITPVYGWVRANLSEQLTERYGSVENFEDKYQFDMAHIFGGPAIYDKDLLEKAAAECEDGILTPDVLLEVPFHDPDCEADYASVKKDLDFYGKERGRFCYIQSNGSFELNNGFFGIENHICYTALYKDELKELYMKQSEWRKKVAMNMIDLGVDMIHISDDWGAQNNLMFIPDFLRECILPAHKAVAEVVKQRGTFLSLHSDGNVEKALDVITEIGFDLVHPWQESAGMSYDLYLEKYSNTFAILGGICIQSTLGFGDYERVKSEIERVFNTFKGKRWVARTTHFVQDHCSLDELEYAYDLILKLSGKK